ncbi:MAG: hypothetical protein F9K13_07020 [Candidatus Methylomirabilis oxygeniifera]|uniref:Uncharacterized protein n=1 Tax=Methylomirabilis oxygeniifera TaxID=671143 RepID=D5MH54_METO1|nr:MAG: hypothetical protein F9K13_07020 [Candidatus Methylomirabilis oxyfera]CBE69085.1 protein of unknown function [Candidatus Methylomirabilis oxyfera]
MSIADSFYKLVESASTALDIKVRSPYPGQVVDRPELRKFIDPEHVLVRKAKAGVRCRLICLDPESSQAFFARVGSKMADTPYFERTEAMIAALETAGGHVRRVGGGPAPELSFAVADGERAVLFLGAWGAIQKFEASVFETTDQPFIRFLETAFELCWSCR